MHAAAPAGDEVEWSAAQAMTATTVAGVGTRIGATENGVAAAVRRAMLLERDAPLPVDEAREIYRGLPDVARPGEPSAGDGPRAAGPPRTGADLRGRR